LYTDKIIQISCSIGFNHYVVTKRITSIVKVNVFPSKNVD